MEAHHLLVITIIIISNHLINIATTVKPTTLVKVADSLRLSNPDGRRADFFASTVAMNKKFVAVGSFRDDVGGLTDVGSVSVFRAGDGALVQKLVPSDGTEYDYFGLSIAFGVDTLAVGSLQDLGGIPSRGCVYFYTLNANRTSWTFLQKVKAAESSTSKQFGISVAVRGDMAVVGGSKRFAVIHVLHFNGTAWTHRQLLTTSETSADNTYGTTVAIGGMTWIGLGLSYVALGDRGYAGMVCLYHKVGGVWQQHTVLTSRSPAANGWYGRSISMTDRQLVVGAEGEDGNRGRAYVYNFNPNMTPRGGEWRLESILKPSHANSYHFGFSLSLYHRSLLVGVFRKRNGTHEGKNFSGSFHSHFLGISHKNGRKNGREKLLGALF